LQEYCYEDPNKLANILAADKGGVFDRESANLRFDLFESGREDELAQALIAIVTPEDKKHDGTRRPSARTSSSGATKVPSRWATPSTRTATSTRPQRPNCTN
jgi:hypothetical protein